MEDFISEYKAHTTERSKSNIPPLPLNIEQTEKLIQLIASNTKEDIEYLLGLLQNNITPGVDDSAKIKADFLRKIAFAELSVDSISSEDAIRILGTMLGGYNIEPLTAALELDEDLASKSAAQLKNTLLVYDSFAIIENLINRGNKYAKDVMQSWANAEWFTSKKALSEEINLTVYKVPGETNTDDLSPASHAFTRSDIPLHANSMLSAKTEDPLDKLKELKEIGNPIVYVGDVVGTGSSRKSGINSLQWHTGESIPSVPNKKTGGIVIGATIAPIFFNTAQDSGTLPIETSVNDLNMGDIITIKPYAGEILKSGKIVSTFELKPNTILDEIRAGGRIPLIIGKNLTAKAREFFNLPKTDIFIEPEQPKSCSSSYTLAQKIVGKACGIKGVIPGTYCEPTTTTVGSQDTTGPMTRDEIKELAALKFDTDLFMQSFCHTSAYPKASDIVMHNTLPEFIESRKGVALRPGDGVIHSWLNRLLLPDTVGTGGDSHTRFPIGISFPAGSGLVAFAGVTGTMPLNMPESVLVKFKGKLNPGITLRDLVNAIPYYAIKDGSLTIAKKNKKNIFSGKIIEIEGLENLKCEQAFELSDASAERSAAACTVKLNREPITEYLKSNIALINNMLSDGYGDNETLQRRACKMQEWVDSPSLLEADKDARYSYTLEIDLADIKEPILACPNDPDDVATLSEILADPNRLHNIEDVFVGSCMTNIGLFRAVGEILKDEGRTPAQLWIAPPTKMDEKQLRNEGYYSVLAAAGARFETPGCSLCMGNQARVKDNAVVFSTSTRNFNNRLGNGAQVYLGSAEVAAVVAKLGRIPTKTEYFELIDKKIIDKNKIYNYLDFSMKN